MTIYYPIELEAHLQLVEELIDSGLSREEAEESITEQDKQTRVERLKSSGALERFRCWTYPMNKSMFDEVAYRSILEERMNSGLTKLEAMESITDEQVEKRITEKEAIFSCPKCGQKHQTFAKKTFTTHCKECAHKFIVSTERDIPSVKEFQPSEPTSSRPFWTWRTKLWVVLLAIMFLVVLGSV